MLKGLQSHGSVVETVMMENILVSLTVSSLVCYNISGVVEPSELPPEIFFVSTLSAPTQLQKLSGSTISTGGVGAAVGEVRATGLQLSDTGRVYRRRPRLFWLGTRIC